MRKPLWLLIGGDSMLGKEIRDLVEEQKLPVLLRLASSLPSAHVLARAAQEEEDFAVMEPLDAALLEEADVVLLGGSLEVNRQALAMARTLPAPPAFVDLAAHFEDLPESRLRAPILEAAPPPLESGAIHTLAHPAALALARVLALVHPRFPLLHSVATIFEPASQHGRAGIDELHQQTVNLFNFQQPPQDVFDAQVSFNLLPRYGSQAPRPLSESADRIDRHLASLLGERAIPLPSTRLIQAPVFHGYCLNLWLAFDARPAPAALESLLADAGLDIRTAVLEPASNVSVAGHSGLAISDIAEDRACPRAAWLWLAFDNIRAQAEAALLAAGTISRGRLHG